MTQKEVKIQTFEHSWQANAVLEVLREKGIEGRVTFRPREYVTVLVGGPQDQADLFVSTLDERSAREVLKQFFREREIKVVDESVHSSMPSKNDFRTVVIYNLLGTLFPVLFPLLAIPALIRLLGGAFPGWQKLLGLVMMGFGLSVSVLVLSRWMSFSL